jgi:hypothetical protein
MRALLQKGDSAGLRGRPSQCAVRQSLPLHRELPAALWKIPPLAQRLGEGGTEYFANRMLIVLRGPLAQCNHRGCKQSGVVENGCHSFELLVGKSRAIGGLDQHAGQLATAKRQAQTGARLQLPRVAAFREQVVKQPAQRDRDGDAQDGGVGCLVHDARSIAKRGLPETLTRLPRLAPV